MAFVDEFKDLMATTVIWRPLTGRDDFGKPTYDESTDGGGSFSARLVRKHRLVRDSQGDQVVSTSQVWVAGSPAIDPDDHVELADGTRPPIVTVERYDDEDGTAFTKVFFR